MSTADVAEVQQAQRARQALTLVELLTSVSIALTLSVLATVAFLQIQRILQRTSARVEMHNSARFLHQAFTERLAALQQDAALWVETRKDDGSRNGRISLTFLAGKTDEKDYNTFQNGVAGTYGQYQSRCCDLAWCDWIWDQRTATLSAGMNTRPREFKLATSWAGPNGDYGCNASGGFYGDCLFVQMPQPLRQAVPYPAATPANSAQAALSGNRYGSPDLFNDISDYQDLKNQTSPVLRNVTGCAIELVLDDGSVVDADATQDRILPFDGCFVDGRVGGAGGSPSKKRPRLIRMLFDLTEPVTRVSQSFSFSFQPPGLLPTTFPAGNPVQ